MVSKGIFGAYDAGASAFAAILTASPSKIIRRDCASCKRDNPAATVFYKRLTPLPAFDLLNVMKSNWTLAPGNAFNKDFELYSSLDAALAGDSAKRWTFCNGDDPAGVGAFRDCGPTAGDQDQWNTWVGAYGGGQPDVLFAVSASAHPGPAPPPPTPPPTPPTPPPPPPPTPGPGPFPGPELLHPKIHFTPPYVSERGGWHDIAGAITHNGLHHIYQGTGWNHAFSGDLVHWQMGVHGPAAIHETYAGMDSTSDPCSGFITKDPLDGGRVCAGFRQCGSNKGVAGSAHGWDVPLELRCALNDELTEWANTTADIDYLFNVSWWRPIPYDPARPWQEQDGTWYQLLSMDGCNTTAAPKLPCEAGGQLVMWKSPALRGPTAAWEKVGAVFSAKDAVLDGAHLTKEFVTIDYIGFPAAVNGTTASGQPDPRFFLNNNEDNNEGCCSGTTSYFPVTQAPGAPMVQQGPQSMVDWGAFVLADATKAGLAALTGTGSRGLSMARTLGSEEADQVSKPGRRVLIGWTGPSPTAALGAQGSAQSLARDLSASSDGKTLLQAFVPELQVLREVHHTGPAAAGAAVAAGVQAEVLATFPADTGGSVSVLGDDQGATVITIDTARRLVIVNATSQGNRDVRAGPLPNTTSHVHTVHIYVDHSIIELIVDNTTALVVYATPASGTGNVQLTAGAAGASLDVWTLRNANNDE